MTTVETTPAFHAERTGIDKLDTRLVLLLVERQNIIENVARYKFEKGLAVRNPERFEAMLQRLKRFGAHYDVAEETIETIWTAIHEDSVRIQESLIKKWKAEK